MLFVPFPFVVAILLVVLFAIVALRDDEAAANLPFLVLILVGACLSLLTGLRWGYGVEEAAYLAPVLAATVPPLAYLGVARLVGGAGFSRPARLALHAMPSIAVVVLIVTWRQAIDIALVLVFVGYAASILLLMRRGTDALRLAPFDGADRAYRAILFAAFALLFSAAVDTFIFFDMACIDGEHALTVITLANLFALVILAFASASASRSHVPAEIADVAANSEPVQEVEEVDDVEAMEDTVTIGAVQELMMGKRAYRDVDLNLNRVARKLGIPARKISVAINQATGKNVSQFVNEYRISEACGMLTETGKPVTEIMFEVGFQTKSNFNREFRRVTDMTPLEWRERNTRRS